MGSLSRTRLNAPPPAWAGPPLICHPFAIADDAKSLPWGNGGFNKDRKFDVKNQLVPQTLALLNDEMPILVRMETMRRAALYGENNRAPALELLAALEARILNATLKQETKPLAWFDAGYFAQSLQQISVTGRRKKNQSAGMPANLLAGYEWALKALELQPEDTDLAFGVALTLNASHEYLAAEGYQKQQDQCLRIALKATGQNNLLKRNIENHFNITVALLNKKLANDG